MGEDDINTDILRRAEEALARWQARAKVRNGRSKALRAGKALQADTPSRLAARAHRTMITVAQRRVTPPPLHRVQRINAARFHLFIKQPHRS